MLKIVSMTMIITLHMLGHGGILETLPIMSGSYQAAWLMEIACYGAVNCYALISGFLLARCNVRKLFELWLQVIFYSLGITIFMNCTLLAGTISKEEWVYSIFPITSRKSWYITAYFGMMCLIPIMRIAIDKIDKLLYRRVIIAIFLIYSILPVIVRYLLQGAVNIDPFTVNGGYSSLWLCLMYLFGAYIRKYFDYKKVKRRICLSVFVLMTLLTFLSKICMEKAGNIACANILVDYTSPTIFLGSLALLVLFVNINFENIETVKKWRVETVMAIFSNATLGVYLIHDNNLIRNGIVARLFESELSVGAYKRVLLKLIIVVLAVYLVCSIIDIVRNKIFHVIKRALSRIQTES